MSINLALNTIIYIILFLFPGILFRKVYFSGKFSNTYGCGNLLESFLWTLFFSLVCLLSVYLIAENLSNVFGFQFINAIDYSRFVSIIETLSNNKIPEHFDKKSNFNDFIKLIFFIYIISFLLGLFFRKIILIFSLDKEISIIKFNTRLNYLTKSNKNNTIFNTFSDIWTTYIAVLIKDHDKEELYEGILEDLILGKDDKLENIIMSDAYKFMTIRKGMENKLEIEVINTSIENKENRYSLHKEYDHKIVYKKYIGGDLLVLPNENIVNLKFTYQRKKNREGIYTAIFYVIFIAFLLFPFLEFPRWLYLQTMEKKVLFSITTFTGCLLLLFIIRNILRGIRIRSDLSLLFLMLSFVIVQYLWIFDIVLNTTIILILEMLLFIYYIYYKKSDVSKKEEQE